MLVFLFTNINTPIYVYVYCDCCKKSRSQLLFSILLRFLVHDYTFCRIKYVECDEVHSISANSLLSS